jgi:hypothetical protein
MSNLKILELKYCLSKVNHDAIIIMNSTVVLFSFENSKLSIAFIKYLNPDFCDYFIINFESKTLKTTHVNENFGVAYTFISFCLLYKQRFNIRRWLDS